MEFTSTLEKFEDNLWSHHIPVTVENAGDLTANKNRRVLCSINDSEPFHCALMPHKLGGYFINVHKELRKKLGLNTGDQLHIKLQKDESKYGMPLPDELKKLFELDDEGNQLFHALTPGKQRTLLYMVGKPKTAQTRIKKAIVIIEYLKFVNGKLDFKELNQAFKQANEDERLY